MKNIIYITILASMLTAGTAVAAPTDKVFSVDDTITSLCRKNSDRADCERQLIAAIRATYLTGVDAGKCEAASKIARAAPEFEDVGKGLCEYANTPDGHLLKAFIAAHP